MQEQRDMVTEGEIHNLLHDRNLQAYAGPNEVYFLSGYHNLTMKIVNYHIQKQSSVVHAFQCSTILELLSSKN